jgi:uncharacterized membrane protein YsdA (DUF1294 family)
MARTARPHTFHAAVALALTLALTLALFMLFKLQAAWYTLLACWLGAVTVTTFGYYAYDKARARGTRSRIPEAVLHGLALAGGTLGALLAMWLFRHKTIKGSFRLVFWTIAVLQVGLVAALCYRLWTTPSS